jgi:SET domain-containing protein
MKTKSSKIAGKGVFATEDLKPGTKLLQFTGPTMTADEASGNMEEYTLQVGRNKYFGPSGKLDDLVNHSCDPNCGLKLLDDQVWLVSFRPILEGEELTFDYSTTVGPNDGWMMTCLCGSKECRSSIGQYSSLSPATRKKYEKLGLDFVKGWSE